MSYRTVGQERNTMAQWRIKEMSDLTNISIRMLRHYDKIGLLRPSGRSANGYRWYSEKDLALLQQIVALKFFGFTLQQMHEIMGEHKLSIKQHLQVQQQMLKSQAEQITHAQQAIATILDRMQSSQAIEWNDLLMLIERYRMTQDAKNTWEKALNAEQLAEWISLKLKYPAQAKMWQSITQQINNNELGNPESPGGEKAVKTFLELNKNLAKEDIQRLRRFNASLTKSVKDGKISELALSPEGNMWLGKASLAYWLNRWQSVYKDIKSNLDADPTGAVGNRIACAWHEIVNDSLLSHPTSPSLIMGTMFWQELARQKASIDEMTTTPSLQEMMNKEVLIEICLDADAINWIEEALNALKR
jgi:DNA-binding transcriptional MerR regulator